LYAGDLNQIQDQYADLFNLLQSLGVGSVAVGESGLQIIRYGPGEARLSGALRTDGIIRALGGLYAGAFTTTARDAIPTGLAPYGLQILNTTTNRFEWNAGTDAARVWQPLGTSSAPLDYKQIIAPASTTATSEGTSTSLITGNSVSYDGSRNRIEFWCPSVTPTNQFWAVIYRDTTVLGQFTLSGIGTPMASVITFDTPPAGLHTYKVFGFVDTGTGTIQAGAGGSGNRLPAFLQVTKA
jgi:hypothetical protein